MRSITYTYSKLKCMIKNHLVSAFRNLLKHKGFTLIHVGGLAIGLTAGIFVLHYARLEYSYDEFHQNAIRTYRISTVRLRDGIPVTHFASTFAAVAPAIKAEFPEVEASARLFYRFRSGIISHETTHFRENDIMHPDSGFFKVFSFPVLSGNKDDLFKPGVAFVEEKTAKKYFGNQDPIGKRISFGSFDGIEEYEIRGVIKCPENSSLKFTFLFSYHDLGRIFGTQHETNWSWLDFHTFVTLKPETDPNEFEKRLGELMRRNLGERADNSSLKLQHLPSIYLQSKTEFETGKTGNETTVRVLLILGIVILSIVALNFINLSTSRTLTRAKEVGIRKVLGSTRQNLIAQFLIETSLANLITIILCMLMIGLVLPYFNQLTQYQIDFQNFLKADLWRYMVIFFLGGTLIIGIYPALMLSSFKAVEVLKGFFSSQGQGAFLRETFVGFQALVSFSLVTAILIIIDQVNYVNSKDLGMDITKTMVVRTPDVVTGDNYLSTLTTFKNRLLQDSRIVNVCTTVNSPGSQVSWIGGSRKLNADPNDVHSVYRAVVDEDYFQTLQINIIAGKGFSTNQSNRDVIINQKSVSEYQYSSPQESLSGQVLIGRDTFTIIGVVEDFHQVSPREAIVPTAYHYNLESPELFLVKYSGSETAEILQLAADTFRELYPNVPFDYFFLDEFFNRQYDQERRLTAIITVFCVLAVIVSSLGLLGLTWFRLSRQKKELAVRKIIGSTEWQLFLNASGRIMLTTTTGCIIGIPITWIIMNQWLETFSYHTSPGFLAFLVALIFSLLIALISISGHTLKVIKTNPVNHLRQD